MKNNPEDGEKLIVMHKLLLRQLKEYEVDLESLPENLKKFMHAVSNAYINADKDHALIERSLELNSKEMGEINRKLEGKLKEFDSKKRDLERINKFMIGREIRMSELKREIKELKRKYEGS